MSPVSRLVFAVVFSFFLSQDTLTALEIRLASFKSFIVGSGSQALAASDFNNDGKIDVALAFRDRISIALGMGEGEFAKTLDTSVPFGAHDLAIADFDSDGRQDAMTVNRDGRQVLYYQGQGDGTFLLEATQGVDEGIPNLLGVGDFDRDGVLDVAAATSVLGQGVWTYFGTSSGVGDYGFSAPRSFFIPVFEPKVILVDDINADGKLDIITSFSVLLGDGTGGFSFLGPPVLVFPPGVQRPAALISDDFNGDGAPDLAYGMTGSSPGTDRVLIYHQFIAGGSPSGIFSLVQDLGPLEGNISGIAAGEVDGAGPRDLVVLLNGDRLLEFDLDGEGFLLLHGETDGTFRVGGRFYSGESPSGAAILDVDEDGKNDLIISNAGIFSPTLVVLKGTGAGNFNIPPAYFVGSLAVSLVAEDLNQDHHSDLAVGTQGGVVLLVGNGDGTFQSPALYPAGQEGPVAVGDFNRDKIPDVVRLDVIAQEVHLLLGDGSGMLSPSGIFPVGLDGQIGVADFNRDKKLDVVASGHFEGLRSAIAVLYGDGTGDFPEQEFLPTIDGYRPNRLMVANFMGNKDPDVALLHQQSYIFDFRTVVALFPNSKKKDPVFDPEVVLYPYISPDEAGWPNTTDGVAADFNGDRSTDLAFYRAADQSTAVFLGNGDGEFAEGPPTFSGIDSSGMVAADLNCDGWPDLIQPNKNGDNVAILAGDGHGGLEPGPSYGVEIRPRGAAAADFNEDGLLDVAVANGHTGSVSVLLNRSDCLVAKLKLSPSRIDLNEKKKKPKEIKAKFSLPKGTDEDLVDVESIRLHGLSPVQVKEKGQSLEAIFDTDAFISLLPSVDHRTHFNVRLTARLFTGEQLVGVDRIRIDDKGR